MSSSATFERRRRDLMELAGPDSLVVVASAGEMLRNGDSHHAFRQNSDFLYLTGYSEPDAVLVMAVGREAGEHLLFCRPGNPERERWDGPRLGLDGAREQLGMDDAYPIEDLDEILPGLMEGRERIYHAVGRDPAFDRQVIGWRNR
ncbi:MAG: aminopeptidase P N-terminal domain-containing protein, partial [Xanthomonadaceae bacterium]|nr:aminopeptidase P N-terminal domain-containing protein [Xanthomonadaceae bacterium]